MDFNVKYSCQFPQHTIKNASLKILFQNVRSLRNKLTDLTNYVQYNRNTPHIIILNETWLSDYETDLFNLPGYQSFHSTRKKTGGGVSIFVLKSFSKCNQLECFEHDNSNFLILEIESLKVKIGSVYRPPSSNDNVFFDKLDFILEKYQNMLAFGDLNYDLFDVNETNTKKLSSIITTNGFAMLNSLDALMFTRKSLTEGCSSKCLDHVFTDLNLKFNFELAMSDIPSLKSDHRAIWLSVFSMNEKSRNINKYFEFTKTDHEAIKKTKALLNINNNSFEVFVEEFRVTLQNNTRTIRVKEKFRKPFMNIEILNYMTIRDNYWRLLKIYDTNLVISERYKYYRRKVVSLIRSAQICENDKILSQNINDSRKVWKHLNNILRNRDAALKDFCSSIKIQEKTTTNGIQIADHLNSYFVNVASQIKSKILANTVNNNSHILEMEAYEIEHSFIAPKCTEDEVKQIIKSLKSSDAQDFYGISNNILKFHSCEIASSLAKLINQSLDNGDFPDVLKLAVVKPLFKGGDKTQPNNYRPISILPIISKILESSILSRLVNHLTSNSIISENQFGFVTKSNTEAAVLHLLNKIYNNIEEKKITATLFIDYQKAFDCLDHKVLIQKFKKLELSRPFLNILISFISNRQQCVKNNDITSDFREVTSGVPQGSILGPTCFLIYINSISRLRLNGDIQLYADDCAIVYNELEFNSMKYRIEDDLKKLKTWMECHFMSINVSKTYYLLFQGRKKLENPAQLSLNVKYGNEIIDRVEKVKYLGLFIDEDLKFQTHLEHIRNKLLPMAFAIRRIRHRISEKTANQLYFAHVYSHLTFMNPLWSSANKERIGDLFVIQKKVLKMIHKKNILTPTNELFSNKILPLPVINDYHLLILAFKIKHNLIKHNSIIQYVNEVHSYNTRQTGNFYVTAYETRYGCANFYHRGLTKYNQLSDSVKKFHTIKIFKLRLREHLYKKYIDEFGM